MTREDLKKLIEEALEALGVPKIPFSLEYPQETSNGDFATNAALLCAQELKQSPKEIAEKLREYIKNKNAPYIQNIEVAGPGFVNFFLSDEYFLNALSDTLSQREGYGSNTSFSGKKVIIEYTDPNPFKELHIGHLMSNAIGESLSRIIEASGAEVKRANYQGDVGLHVAKALWGIQQGESDLGKAYTLGAKKYEEDKAAKEEIILINQKIYEGTDEALNIIYENGKAESLERFESIYTRLGTHFDYYFFESETGRRGKKIVEENIPNIFQESEGAIIYQGEKKGLHTRVFITSKKLPTYEAKELGLAHLKEEEYPHNISIVITGNEVIDYFKVAQAALEDINKTLSEKTKHIPHGMLRLTSGKMSSRTGDVISAEDLLESIKNILREKVQESKHVEENEDLLDCIAVSAIKYAVLKQDSGKDIIFDFEKSISFTGDSGPYLQYTYARTQSILKKGESEGLSPSLGKAIGKEKDIARSISKFPHIVLRALNNHAPHYIATYLQELAHTFNTYYADQQIVNKEDPISPHRLAVTEGVAYVLKNGLHLLGISAPDKM